MEVLATSYCCGCLTSRTAEGFLAEAEFCREGAGLQRRLVP